MRKWETNSDVLRKKIASAEESDSTKVCTVWKEDQSYSKIFKNMSTRSKSRRRIPKISRSSLEYKERQAGIQF